jgi:fibronectin type 3 domain-containing protein
VTGSSGAIALSWSAPSNGGSAITGYKVYRSTVSGSETLLVTLGVVTSYTNTGLTNGATYYYKVSAVNVKGEGAKGAEVHAVPITTSGIPGPFTMTAKSAAGQVVLAWTVPSSSTPIASFSVMRKDSTGVETTVAKLPASRTGYTDLTAVAGKTYSYRMTALNSAGSTSTPSVTVQTVAAVGHQNTYDLGVSNQDVPAVGLGALISVITGTICFVVYVRSRMN